MIEGSFGTPSELLSQQQERIDRLMVFWRLLLNGDDSGSTSWEVLEYLYYRVSRALGESPPNLHFAEEITAQALFQIAGRQRV